ncbi:MAG: hypothetical protein K0R21_743 [Anaerocolumna sp.]|jgi:lia operon protein LiaG|nr:hypothetical protein [Anaerocolumna sp.]
MCSGYPGISISLKGVKIMKTFIYSFIAILSIIAIGLVGLLILAINKGDNNVSFDYSKVKLVNTQNISLDDIDSITIEYQSDDVIFYTSDTDELILKEYMSFTPNKDQLGSITKSGNALIIKGENRDFHFSLFNFGNYSKAEIYLPSKYAGKLSVATSSGDIDSDPFFKLSEYEASSTSGDLKLNEVYAENINVSSSSGNITFQKAEGKRHFSSTSGNIRVFGGNGDSDVSSSSGNITIDKAVGQLVANSSSGNISIKAFSCGGDFNTTSGNIRLECSGDMNATIDKINIGTSSGDVALILPPTLQFNFSAETSSGDIRTFFDDMLSFNRKGNQATGIVGENPDRSIQINTTSGNIRISKN